MTRLPNMQAALSELLCVFTHISGLVVKPLTPVRPWATYKYFQSNIDRTISAIQTCAVSLVSDPSEADVEAISRVIDGCYDIVEALTVVIEGSGLDRSKSAVLAETINKKSIEFKELSKFLSVTKPFSDEMLLEPINPAISLMGLYVKSLKLTLEENGRQGSQVELEINSRYVTDVLPDVLDIKHSKVKDSLGAILGEVSGTRKHLKNVSQSPNATITVGAINSVNVSFKLPGSTAMRSAVYVAHTLAAQYLIEAFNVLLSEYVGDLNDKAFLEVADAISANFKGVTVSPKALEEFIESQRKK